MISPVSSHTSPSQVIQHHPGGRQLLWPADQGPWAETQVGRVISHWFSFHYSSSSPPSSKSHNHHQLAGTHTTAPVSRGRCSTSSRTREARCWTSTRFECSATGKSGSFGRSRNWRSFVRPGFRRRRSAPLSPFSSSSASSLSSWFSGPVTGGKDGDWWCNDEISWRLLYSRLKLE